MKALKVYPQKTPLKGTITVPGDKSISHRSVMLGGIANGVSYVKKWLPAGDPLATLGAVRALGVTIIADEKSPTAWDLTIDGRGLHGFVPPTEPLNLRHAGTGIRLLAGIMAGQKFPSILDGSEQLRKRPMKRITVPLGTMGADITTTDGKAPMHVTPATLQPGNYEMPVASAQVKSAVLLAGLYADGATRVYQPGPARDHTERMLTAMGVTVTEANGWVSLTPVEQLKPLDLTVPADTSSAAFPLVAAAIVPHSEITIENCGMNETRTGIIDILREMGANVSLANEKVTGGEPAADLTITFSEMHSLDVAGEVVVRAIDEFPILTVALSQAAGSSSVSDAHELRVKEVDRITVLAGELRKMGMVIDEKPDGYTLTGPMMLSGATVDSHEDHRLAMSLTVAALMADSPTTILQADCATDSFPGFVETMQALGATLEWI